MTFADRRSIVAIDPTPRGVAYVYFDRGELLDWGHRHCGRKSSDVVVFVAELLAKYEAQVVIAEDSKAVGSRRRPRMKIVLQAITRDARARGLRVMEVARRVVSDRWRERGVTTKEAMAAEIARELPELQPYVPSLRRTWMSEHPHVNVFDAVSLALHALRPLALDLVR
jgi:hypothetical protein